MKEWAAGIVCFLFESPGMTALVCDDIHICPIERYEKVLFLQI
jgi:hypothetical protein